MEEIRKKLKENGQNHILEAFPNLKATDTIAKQLAKVDVRSLLEIYEEAKALDSQYGGTNGGTGCIDCNACGGEILPARSIRLNDDPKTRYIHYMSSLPFQACPFHHIKLLPPHQLQRMGKSWLEGYSGKHSRCRDSKWWAGYAIRL